MEIKLKIGRRICLVSLWPNMIENEIIENFKQFGKEEIKIILYNFKQDRQWRILGVFSSLELKQ